MKAEPPRRPQTLATTLNSASEDLTRRLRRAPNASELAAELGFSREYVIDALIAAWHCDPLPLDSCDGDDHRFAAAVAACEESLEAVESGSVPRRLLAGLPRYERAVVMMRFSGAMSQHQIAERLGISRPQVSELLAKALSRIRAGVNRTR